MVKKKLKPFSVLLLYPDYIGQETYYAWVRATDSVDAVARAQRQAVRRNNQVDVGNETDFYPLLVLRGHRVGLSTGVE